MPLVSNQVLQDRYEVVRSIKSGGMGAVYQAIDRKLADTPCAIKEVLCAALAGPQAQYVMNSFQSEMRALATLEHHSIPRVRDYFEIDGRRYIVLDYVQGKPLDDELQEHLRVTGEAMDPYLAALDMLAVLETLTYLHSHKPPVVHRDIKPANLIRDEKNGRIKLVDFGIARSIESQQVNTQVGTPGFCAPEQMAGRAEMRFDLYSVGATLYNLVTGTLPPAFTFDALQPSLPKHPGLCAIIKRATSIKPSERYSSAESMANALRAWAQGRIPVPSQKVIPPVKVTPINPLARPPEPPSSNLLVASIFGLLLASYALWPTPPTTEPPQPPPTVTASPALVARPPAARLPAFVPRRVPERKTPPPVRKVPVALARLPQPVASETPSLPDALYPQSTGRSLHSEAEYARRSGLTVLERDATHAKYLSDANGYQQVLEVWHQPGSTSQQMIELAQHFRHPAPDSPGVRRSPRRVPSGHECYFDATNNLGYHALPGVFIRIEPMPRNLADAARTNRLVDNWPPAR